MIDHQIIIDTDDMPVGGFDAAEASLIFPPWDGVILARTNDGRWYRSCGPDAWVEVDKSMGYDALYSLGALSGDVGDIGTEGGRPIALISVAFTAALALQAWFPGYVRFPKVD